MPVPLLALAGGSMVLNHLFNKSPEFNLPTPPTFFGQDFHHYLAALKQKDQASFGGAEGDIRESLANAGVLQSGALPQAFTQLNIQKGQNIAEDQAGAYGQEHQAQLGFETGPKYAAGVQKSQLDYAHQLDQRQQQMNDLNRIVKALGPKPKPTTNTPDTQDPNDPATWWDNQGNDITGSADNNVQRILKLIFGVHF